MADTEIAQEIENWEAEREKALAQIVDIRLKLEQPNLPAANRHVFEKEIEGREKWTEEIDREIRRLEREKVEQEKGRFVGGIRYAGVRGRERIAETGRSIKEAPGRAKEAGKQKIDAARQKASDVREHFWSYAGRGAGGAAVTAGKAAVTTGKAAVGTVSFLGRFAKGAESWFTGEKASGSFKWLIWVGLAIHLIDWQILNFKPSSTLTNIELLVLLFILTRHYGFLTRFDFPHVKKWIAAFLLSLFVFNYVPNIVTQYGSLYGWFLFVPIMFISSPGLAFLVFLEFDGLAFIANTFPFVLTTPYAFIFDARILPFWLLFAVILTPESKWSKRIVIAYAIFLIFFVGGFSGETAFAQKLFLGQEKEKIQAIAGERTEATLEKDNLLASVGGRIWLCSKGVFGIAGGDSTVCARIFESPEKVEGEEELTEGGIDRAMEQKVAMEWFTEPDTISVGEEPSASAILSVTSLKDIVMDVECWIKGKRDSGIAKPDDVQIERRRAGEEKIVICNLEKQSLLKEGKNSILFDAKILGSQLDASSWYVFYPIGGHVVGGLWFEVQEEELLSDRNEKELFDQDKQSRGPSAAKLRLYEKRLLPKIIENMEDKIRRSYEYYPNERIESKSEPGFIKIKMSINNDVPFVGIEQGTELVFRMSVENTVPDGRIIEVSSGYVEMPEWFEPHQEECELLDKNTKKKINSRDRYNIAEKKLKIDWSVYDFGFSNRKRFEPCKLIVKTASDEINGFELYDLNDVLINGFLSYDFGVETKTTLTLEKGVLAEIYIGNLDSFPIEKVSEISFSDDFGERREDGRKHEGIDIFTPKGTNVRAAKAGEILKIGCNELGGNRVGILDNSGDFFYYAHLNTFASDFEVGEHVNAGQSLGTVGDTIGCNETCMEEGALLCGLKEKTEPHLHFGIYRGGAAGTALNPYSALERIS